MARKKPVSGFIDFGDDDPSKVTGEETQAHATILSVQNPYVGNKRQIIWKITAALRAEEVEYQSVFDLFSGSAVVSLFMKLLGKRVFSNDLLTSSYYNALVFVENTDVTLSNDEIDFLLGNKNSNKTDFVRSKYSNRFTPQEAEFLDNYRANIDTLSNEFVSTLEDEPLRQVDIKRALCFVMIEHYIMEKCFLGGRLNSGQILAKLDHRIAHGRNDGNTMKFALTAPRLFKGIPGQSLNKDATEALQEAIDADLLYLDLPYGGDQSDYAQMFRFNEEYVFGKPLDELPHIANSKKFVSKKDYRQNFIDLLSHAKRFPCWAISYNNSSWTDMTDVEQILKDCGRQVKVIPMDHEYKYRSKENRSDATEYLLIAR